MMIKPMIKPKILINSILISLLLSTNLKFPSHNNLIIESSAGFFDKDSCEDYEDHEEVVDIFSDEEDWPSLKKLEVANKRKDNAKELIVLIKNECELYVKGKAPVIKIAHTLGHHELASEVVERFSLIKQEIHKLEERTCNINIFVERLKKISLNFFSEKSNFFKKMTKIFSELHEDQKNNLEGLHEKIADEVSYLTGSTEKLASFVKKENVLISPSRRENTPPINISCFGIVEAENAMISFYKSVNNAFLIERSALAEKKRSKLLKELEKIRANDELKANLIEEARQRLLEQQRADEEARQRLLEQQRADEEARQRLLEQQRADEEARQNNLERKAFIEREYGAMKFELDAIPLRLEMIKAKHAELNKKKHKYLNDENIVFGAKIIVGVVLGVSSGLGVAKNFTEKAAEAGAATLAKTAFWEKVKNFAKKKGVQCIGAGVISGLCGYGTLGLIISMFQDDLKGLESKLIECAQCGDISQVDAKKTELRSKIDELKESIRLHEENLERELHEQ